jgi:hypothetical protein
MRRFALLLIPLVSLMVAGCSATQSAKGSPSATIRGESTISIGTYGNFPIKH